MIPAPQPKQDIIEKVNEDGREIISINWKNITDYSYIHVYNFWTDGMRSSLGTGYVFWGRKEDGRYLNRNGKEDRLVEEFQNNDEYRKRGPKIIYYDGKDVLYYNMDQIFRNNEKESLARFTAVNGVYVVPGGENVIFEGSSRTDGRGIFNKDLERIGPYGHGLEPELSPDGKKIWLIQAPPGFEYLDGYYYRIECSVGT